MLFNFLKIVSIICLSIGVVYAQQFKTVNHQELAWGKDLNIESYPDGRYSYLKVLATANGYSYLSLVDQSIYEFNDFSKKTLSINLKFKPLDFTYHSGKYYVQGFHSIHVINALGEIIEVIPYPSSVTSTQSITIDNGILTLKLPNNQTLEYSGIQRSWTEKEGFLIGTEGHVSVARKNDYQYELLYVKNTHSQCLSYTNNIKIGAVIFHGVVNDKWIVELEEIEQEVPLTVTSKLLLVDPADGNIKSSLTIPHQRFTFTPEDIIVENGRIIISLSTATHSLVYEVELGQDLKPFPGYLFENPVHFNTTK